MDLSTPMPEPSNARCVTEHHSEPCPRCYPRNYAAGHAKHRAVRRG